MVDRPKKPTAISAKPTGPQPQVDISSDSSRVTAKLTTGESIEVLLCGATVISWKSSSGQENLWLSDKAVLDGSKAVRGGIPIVFPVFGPPPPSNHPTSSLGQHGFARNAKWEYLGKSTSESGPLSKGGDDCVKLDFGLGSSSLPKELRRKWPYDFSLVYSVTLARDGLQTIMNVRNEGQQAFEFQFLLHSYFKVKDISTTSVAGLMGTSYIDKVLNSSTATESSTQLRITSEVDRVYKSIKQDTTTILENENPRFDIIRDNLSDTVVWNPWKEKAAGMGDFAPRDGYKNMLCVEVGSVGVGTGPEGGWQKLEAGDTFEAGQIIKSML